MQFDVKSKSNKGKSAEIVPPLLLTQPYGYMGMCNVESQKRSAKGSNFKEENRAFPLYTAPKVIDFPRYSMKCSEENEILHGIFHVVFH